MAATDYAGNPIGFTASGLKRVLDGPSFFGVPRSDARVPDLVGVVQHGVVYTGHTAKIAEHGGQDPQDRHVPLLVWGHGLAHGLVTTHVETTEIAPTILHLLGLDPQRTAGGAGRAHAGASRDMRAARHERWNGRSRRRAWRLLSGLHVVGSRMTKGVEMAGQIVHVEFLAEDVDRAQRFWSGLFGWKFGDSGMPEMDYRMAQTGEQSGAAMYASDSRGHPKYYFDTDDIEASSVTVRGARRVGRGEGSPSRPTGGSPPAPTARGTSSTCGRRTRRRVSRRSWWWAAPSSPARSWSSRARSWWSPGRS